MYYLPKLITVAILSVILANCAVTTPVPQDSDDASNEIVKSANQAAEVAVETEIEYGSFSEEQLYETIISEINAQQGNIREASDSYFDLAFETRDLGIIRRASQFASASGDINALVQLGLLWTEIAPDEVEPHLMLSLQLLDAGRFEDAVNHMASVIDLGGQIDFGAVLARTQRMPSSRRERLIENLRQLHNLYPDEQSIQYAIVELLQQNQQPEDALAELQLLKQNQGNSPAALLIEAQLLQRLEQPQRALRVLKNGVRSFPEDKPLRFNYARLLMQDEEYDDARRQFEILVEQDPDDYETLFSIALLDIEMEDYDEAARLLTDLIYAEYRSNDSHFYLGYIAEQREQLEQAISHYRSVQIGAQNFVAAQQQATRFAIQLEQYDEAHTWLVDLSRGQPRLEVLFSNIEASFLLQEQKYDRAGLVLNEMLQRYPNDTDLLFTRVLLHDGLNDMASSEQDLQRIITLLPDDSRALNHLGYMLADRTTRFEEALELIERAISISPDEPAIIDSLAWAQYKLGRYEEALSNLRRAFAAFPDHEVASHLGEVLWVSGQENEAIEIWNDALEEAPDSDLIKEAMQRLNP